MSSAEPLDVFALTTTFDNMGLAVEAYLRVLHAGPLLLPRHRRASDAVELTGLGGLREHGACRGGE